MPYNLRSMKLPPAMENAARASEVERLKESPKQKLRAPFVRRTIQQPPSPPTFEEVMLPCKRPLPFWSCAWESVWPWLQTFWTFFSSLSWTKWSPQTSEEPGFEWALTGAMSAVLWYTFQWALIPAIIASRIVAWKLSQETTWSSPWTVFQMFWSTTVVLVMTSGTRFFVTSLILGLLLASLSLKILELISDTFSVFLTVCESAYFGLKYLNQTLPWNWQQTTRIKTEEWQQTTRIKTEEWQQTATPKMCPCASVLWTTLKWNQEVAKWVLQSTAPALKNLSSIIVNGMHLVSEKRETIGEWICKLIVILILPYCVYNYGGGKMATPGLADTRAPLTEYKMAASETADTRAPLTEYKMAAPELADTRAPLTKYKMAASETADSQVPLTEYKMAPSETADSQVPLTKYKMAASETADSRVPLNEYKMAASETADSQAPLTEYKMAASETADSRALLIDDFSKWLTALSPAQSNGCGNLKNAYVYVSVETTNVNRCAWMREDKDGACRLLPC